MSDEKFGTGYFSRGVNNQWLSLGLLMAARVSLRVLDRVAPRPTYASIVATHNCNYKCMMCSFWHQTTENELSTNEIGVVLRDLRSMGIAQVNFTGGEPLLRKDLAELVHSAASLDFRMIQITTNGSLAQRERLEELIEAGARRFAISCDGVGEHHDLQRGVPGAWKKNIAALDNLRDLRATKYPTLEIELPMVLSKTTVGDLDELMRVCEEYRATVHLQFLDNVQFFTATANFQDQNLSPEEIDQVIDRIHHHIDEARGMDPLVTHEGVEYVRHHMKRQKREGAPAASCGAGYALIFVDSLGNVFPGCFAMAPVGNVRERPLREIVGSPRHAAVAKDMFQMNCPGCPNGYAWSTFINPRSLVREGMGRVRRKLVIARSDRTS